MGEVLVRCPPPIVLARAVSRIDDASRQRTASGAGRSQIGKNYLFCSRSVASEQAGVPCVARMKSARLAPCPARLAHSAVHTKVAPVTGPPRLRLVSIGAIVTWAACLPPDDL